MTNEKELNGLINALQFTINTIKEVDKVKENKEKVNYLVHGNQMYNLAISSMLETEAARDVVVEFQKVTILLLSGKNNAKLLEWTEETLKDLQKTGDYSWVYFFGIH